MALDLSHFTERQRAAIEHGTGNLQLIACAGAGKTEVVACRVAQLLDPTGQHALAPDNVIAFTFAEKAAAELKQRIVKRCEQHLGPLIGMASMYVGTIHGYCLNVLQEEIPEFLKYGVLTEVQQRVFVDRYSRLSGLTASTQLNGTALKRYVGTPRYVSALNILRESRTVANKLSGVSVVEGLASYEALLSQHAYFDYTSMMVQAVEALESNTVVRARVAERVRYVIVDEYQDVNPIQERLVAALHGLGATLCVIGDDDQTIHQWRGSDVRNIITFEQRYAPVTQIRLEDNFRSSEGIVEVAREFIEQNAERLPKAMKPTTIQAYEKGDITALGFDDPEDEAAFIVEQVQALRGVAFTDDGTDRGLALSDMAILLRSVRRNAAPILAAFRDADIPCVIAGLNNLFDTLEARAAREMFLWMGGTSQYYQQPSTADVRRAWIDAALGLEERALDAALSDVEASLEAFDDAKATQWGLYGIQRVFVTFLEAVGLREERVPGDRGDVAFANLGKFSQLISDFESIHFRSQPKEKYPTFAQFLHFQAAELYDEGWTDQQYVQPDAVRIMTVHQAKGMQWPVVFVPAMLRNRFPSKAQGGLSVWHLIPEEGIAGSDRYKGGIEDERRLFYVALTRAQKFLFVTWAPVEGNRLFGRSSVFYENILASPRVRRFRPDFSARPRLTSQPKANVADVALTFSELKYFFECPYQFKLRILYGFNAPLHEALGYGKSLHDSLAEVHADAIRGVMPTEEQIPELLDRHLHLRYAYASLRETLEGSAGKVLAKYFDDNAELLPNLEFSEKQIELTLGDGVTVSGRIDLVRRLDTDETTIVDLKTSERSQDERVTDHQLHIYVLGLRALTGRTADAVEIYALDDGNRKRRSVDEEFVTEVVDKIKSAATALRDGELEARPSKLTCGSCDYRGMCSHAIRG